LGLIHPLAHVDPTVKIGPGTRVWQFASLTRGTVLGKDCIVSAHAMLDGARFGDRCIIGTHVGAGAGFEIGDDVFIGPGVHFANDAWPTVDKEGFDAEGLASGRIVCIRVGSRASIGGHAMILPGVTIGEGAMIAAGAVVSKTVPARHLLTRDGDLIPIKPGARTRMRPC